MNLMPHLSLFFLMSLPLIAEEGFVQIFNGKDLNVWQSIRGDKETEGSLFSVNKEEKAIQTYATAKDGTKQPIGCLYTKKEYSHYILKLEYKWLQRRFPPRATHDRDAGLLFHLHGDLSKLWPNCVEMQLGDSDVKKVKNRYLTGDLWVIGKDLQLLNRRNHSFYKPDSPLVLIGKNKAYDNSYIMLDAEKPHGQWNEITLTVRGSEEAIFELNGKVVNTVRNMTFLMDGKRVPLSKGRIGLQAEYAELLYRNIRIKELDKSSSEQDSAHQSTTAP